MRVKAAISSAIIGLAASAAWAEAPDELTLIVNRDEDSATYYLSMPADLIAPVLASDPALLFSDNGRVPIEEFRRVGSFDLADDIFDNITGSQGGDAFAFEAMSMMVHPTDTPLPFEAPWDAYTAIAVCTVQYDPDKLVPGLLQTYYGGFTDQISGDAPLSLHFPETGRDALEIVVHRYESGRLMGTDVQVLDDGGSLMIETGKTVAGSGWMRSVGSWLGLL
ncbi:MAG: hypothetical protein AAFZ04_05580 [Pseudomonadota bacterium]